MKVLIVPQTRYYQVILERCIEALPYECFDIYSDGELWMDSVAFLIEQHRAAELYP